MTPTELDQHERDKLKTAQDQVKATNALVDASKASVESQQQFIATMNATPDGVPFDKVLQLVSMVGAMLLRLPVPPATPD